MGRPRKEENRVGPSTKYAYLTENKSEVEEKALSAISHATQPYSNGYPNNSLQAQVQKKGYCSQDNVKNYWSNLVTHSFGKNAPKKKGRGTFFETVEEFDEWIVGFFNLCIENEVVPTMSGLTAYLQVDRSVLLNHANNPNSQFYDSAKQAVDICHNILESGATEQKFSSQAYTFQAKNYYKMKDSQDISIGVSQQQTINNSETLQALQEQRSTELKMGSIDMKDATIVEEKS